MAQISNKLTLSLLDMLKQNLKLFLVGMKNSTDSSNKWMKWNYWKVSMWMYPWVFLEDNFSKITVMQPYLRKK